MTGLGSSTTRIGEITGMAGLRRRCYPTLKLREAYAPRNCKGYVFH
ncbi:MAG: hypothetical protein HON55_02105 [Legionellales bacterium]|nr:hypothetical protein [Legionellales bacterium]